MNNTWVTKGLDANLENFELTDIMQLITQQAKSGFLTVKSSDGICSWSFNEGSLVDFDCEFSNHVLELKNILKQSSILSNSQLISLHKDNYLDTNHDLEKILISKNISNREELERTNLRRLIESFVITLQWTKGRYKFIPADKINHHPFLAPQDVNFIILESLRQIDEMAVMKKRLQPLDRIFENSLTLSDDESSGVNGILLQEGLKDQFDQGEFEVYKLFDGRRSLQEIIETSITGQFHSCDTIINFINRNVVALATTETGYQLRKSPEPVQIRNLTGIALLILSGALLLSTFLTVEFGNGRGSLKRPTLFSAIIDNLEADQQMTQKLARELLKQDNPNQSK